MTPKPRPRKPRDAAAVGPACGYVMPSDVQPTLCQKPAGHRGVHRWENDTLTMTFRPFTARELERRAKAKARALEKKK